MGSNWTYRGAQLRLGDRRPGWALHDHHGGPRSGQLLFPGEPVTGNPTFTPAKNGGTSALGANWVANIVGIAAWAQFDGVGGYDMAVCQLDQPFGDPLGYFGARAYDDDWEDGHYWAHVGYPWDLSPAGMRPSFELGISVEDDDSDDFDTPRA